MSTSNLLWQVNRVAKLDLKQLIQYNLKSTLLSVLSCSSVWSGWIQNFKSMLADVVMYGWQIPVVCFVALIMKTVQQEVKSENTRNTISHNASCRSNRRFTISSPGVHCPSRPGGCSVPGCRSAWCHSCWWSAAVFRRGLLGPAAPQWTAAAALWHWLHVLPSPEGTGRSGRPPWGQRGEWQHQWDILQTRGCTLL